MTLYYLLTMSRDLSFYDSAELALVAVQGGLSHPMGHPVHTLLGWLLAHVPGVPPLLGLNALSALPAGLAVLPLVSLAETMAGPRRGSSWIRPRYLLPTAVACVALLPALWECATRAEVYGLASFFALWAVARVGAQLGLGERRALTWGGPGVALGLAAATNPVVAAATGAALVPALVTALARKRIGLDAAGCLIAGGIIGLLPYLYVPLVAGREGVLVWGAPTSGEALARFFSGADFGHNQGAPPGVVARHALEWISWAFGRGVGPVLALGLLAHGLWGREAGVGRPFAFVVFGSCLTFVSMNRIYYVDVTDYLGYMMVPISTAGVGVAVLILRVGAGEGRRKLLGVLLAGAVLLSVVVSPPPPWSRTRHRDGVARLLAEGALENAPRDAVLIVGSDHWVFPLLYLQGAEDVRPDVVVLARGLSGASWFWSYLFDRHPDLRPFDLRGPGGQPARIRRFLEANSRRPVLFENWGNAVGIGRGPGCAGSWLLLDENACDEVSGGEAPDALSPALAAALERIGSGSPTTDAVIANVSLDRGEMLWRLGRSGEALRAFRAGVPSSVLPAPEAGPLDGVGPLRGPLPRWRDRHAIGHFSRNLYAASLLVAASGDEEAARAYFAAAVASGADVPEPSRQAAPVHSGR